MLAEQAHLAQRIAALASYEILDTASEQVFDDITSVVAHALAVPIALISLVEEHRQWFKSEFGLGCRETDYGASVCAHALHSDGIFEIEDLRIDPRTADNPLVTSSPGIQFYAGAVLRTSQGIPIGTVCAIDYKPRRLSDQDRQTLQRLARQTMALLELRISLRRSQAADRARGHHMTTAGHDLRQPLQTIYASIELALRKPVKENIETHLTNAVAAVERMRAELDRLAHAGANRSVEAFGIVFERFSMDEIFDALKPTWEAQTAAKGLKLEVTTTPAHVRSDRHLLSSIIGNLVSNAIKYTNAGGVTVECGIEADQGIEVSVTDTGIGMTDEDLEKIFVPFTQIDNASEGLGLGLSLVKQAAGFLNYRINVTSKVEAGSRFSFIIPAQVRAEDVAE